MPLVWAVIFVIFTLLVWADEDGEDGGFCA